MGTTARDINEQVYAAALDGHRDYWRMMAAPRHRARTIVRELERQDPASVLDVGCGDGALLDAVARSLGKAALAGIDLSAAQVERNRQRRRDIQWYHADVDCAFAVPGLSTRFEAIVSSEVIEHLDHPDQFLQGCARLIAPGGRLYLSTQSGPIRETERRFGHRRHFSADDMRALLVRAGWSPLRVWNTGYPFHDLSKWYANRDPDASLARFSHQAYGLRERTVCWVLRQCFRLNSGRRGAQLFAVAAPPAH